MQKVTFFFFCLLLTTAVWSQSKPPSMDPAKWSMEDMKKFAAMRPAEQEAFKKKMLQQAEMQLKQKAETLHLNIDETILPSWQIKPPVMDVKRLSLIPVKPPTRQEMVQEVSKMEAALRSAVGNQVVQKVEEFAANKSVKEIQSAATGGWYDSNPQSALLLGMKAVQKDSSDVLGWNNLAAIMNLSGLEHQAIPILQNCLQDHPENAMLLNNMGQAFLGLGDVVRSKEFLKKCLQFDDMHPEANRSMAMICLFGNDMAGALKHMEKEFQVAQRKSSLAYLVKSGQRDKINLAALRKRKMLQDGVKEKDFFSEIGLEKFSIPDPPASSKLSRMWLKEHAGLFQSISDEMLFWSRASITTPEQNEAEGKKFHGMYKELADELIRDLGNQYIPLLGVIGEDDVSYLQQLQVNHYKKEKEVVCPDGQGISVEAYNTICCDLKTPLIDELMATYNSYVSAKIKQAQSNYKQYLNGLINIVQLDPSLANRILVYKAVSGYFAFLHQAIGSYLVLDPYMTCYSNNLTSEEARQMIESARNVDIQCPSWLKLNTSFLVAKIKADCNGYNIEADVYKLIHVGAEKNFKTGTSTLYVGGGIEGKFKSMAKGSIKQQFYVVWDANNDFADLGMRGSASGSIVNGALAADFSYDFAMNSGFNAQAKVKSNWIDNYEKAIKFISKK